MFFKTNLFFSKKIEFLKEFIMKYLGFLMKYLDCVFFQ